MPPPACRSTSSHHRDPASYLSTYFNRSCLAVGSMGTEERNMRSSLLQIRLSGHDYSMPLLNCSPCSLATGSDAMTKLSDKMLRQKNHDMQMSLEAPIHILIPAVVRLETLPKFRFADFQAHVARSILAVMHHIPVAPISSLPELLLSTRKKKFWLIV